MSASPMMNVSIETSVLNALRTHVAPVKSRTVYQDLNAFPLLRAEPKSYIPNLREVRDALQRLALRGEVRREGYSWEVVR